MKKIFIISLVLLALTLFFLGIYNFAFKKEKPIQADKNIVEKEILPAQSIPVSMQKITPVSNQGVIGSAYDKKNKSLLYYSYQDGTTWKSDMDGKNLQSVSKTKLSGLKNVSWSPDRTKVLTTLNSEQSDSFYMYDTVSDKAVKLKEGLDTVVWDNMSSKIFYKYYDKETNERTLNVANPDGSEWQKLTDLSFRNVSIAQIPMTSVISFWNFPNSNEETLLQTINISGGQPKTIFTGKYGADYLWSPDGAIALVSHVDKEIGTLMLGTVDLEGTYFDLGIPTLASKCVWSKNGKTVYYALAGSLPEDALVPEDYLNGKINSKDTFWKLDLTTGKKERIIEPEEINAQFDASNLFVSSEEDYLYFENRLDKKLYRIEL